MKLLISLKSKDDIHNLADAYVVGVTDLSVNYYNFSLDEIKEIAGLCKKNNKELFVSLNKNMHNADLPSLRNVLQILDGLDLKGIFYYDAAIVSIHEDLSLKTPLVWSQEHMTTNYHTMNFWQSFGAHYTLVSAEITMEEIKDIKKHTDVELIVPIFGYISMFVSRRHLVKNYVKTFSLKDHSFINYMTKEGYTYPIVDNKDGTTVYSSYILNGLREMLTFKELGVPYVYLNSFGIKDMDEVIRLYKMANKDNVLALEKKIDTMLEGNTDKGFLYKETVYKVK